MYRAPIDKITRPGIVTHSAVVGTRQGQRVYCGTHQGPCAFETVAKILTAVLVIFVVVLSSRERFRAATALCLLSLECVCLSVCAHGSLHTDGFQDGAQERAFGCQPSRSRWCYRAPWDGNCHRFNTDKGNALAAQEGRTRTS